MNHPGEFSSLVLDYQLVAAASGNKILESNRPGEGAGGWFGHVACPLKRLGARTPGAPSAGLAGQACT